MHLTNYLIDKELLNKNIKKLAFGLMVAISRIACLLSGHAKLHSARFAELHELAGLTQEEANKDASLTLGITNLGNTGAR